MELWSTAEAVMTGARLWGSRKRVLRETIARAGVAVNDTSSRKMGTSLATEELGLS
jgi:hypothetical protein